MKKILISSIMASILAINLNAYDESSSNSYSKMNTGFRFLVDATPLRFKAISLGKGYGGTYSADISAGVAFRLLKHFELGVRGGIGTEYNLTNAITLISGISGTSATKGFHMTFPVAIDLMFPITYKSGLFASLEWDFGKITNDTIIGGGFKIGMWYMKFGYIFQSNYTNSYRNSIKNSIREAINDPSRVPAEYRSYLTQYGSQITQCLDGGACNIPANQASIGSINDVSNGVPIPGFSEKANHGFMISTGWMFW